MTNKFKNADISAQKNESKKVSKRVSKRVSFRRFFRRRKETIRLWLADLSFFFKKLLAWFAFLVVIFFIMSSIVFQENKYDAIDSARDSIVTSVTDDEFYTGLQDLASSMRYFEFDKEFLHGVDTPSYYQKILELIKQYETVRAKEKSYELLSVVRESRAYIRNEFPNFEKIHLRFWLQQLIRIFLYVAFIFLILFGLFLLFEILHKCVASICKKSLTNYEKMLFRDIMSWKKEGLDKEKARQKFQSIVRYAPIDNYSLITPLFKRKIEQVKYSEYWRDRLREKMDDLFD